MLLDSQAPQRRANRHCSPVRSWLLFVTILSPPVAPIIKSAKGGHFMRLRSLDIGHFRSIRQTSFSDLGDLNVLIGRNNAGKSAAMRAVSLFFSCLSGRSPVNIHPNVRDQYDFHLGDTSNPITLSACFSLTLSERDSIIREVGQEYPQMQNAIEGISPSLVATVVMEISADRDVYTSHVSRIELQPSAAISAPEASFTLLDLPSSAAEELAARSRSVETLTEKVDVLQSAIPIAQRQSRNVRGSGELRYLTDFIMHDLPSSKTEAARKHLPQIIRRIGDADQVSRVFADELAKAEAQLLEVKSRPMVASLRTFAGETTELPQHVGTFLERIAQLSVHYLTENRRQIGRIEAQRLLELKVSRGGPEVLRRIQETVLGLLGVSIDAFQAATNSHKSNTVAAELDVDNFLVEVNGSGIREALRVVLDVEFNNPDILLVEEPEVHLHPALEVALMRYLKTVSAETQVVLATHSTNFLDTGDMASVHLVRKSGATDITRLSLQDAEVEIPKDLGIRLSSLFMYDKLIFVEGPSDEVIIREFAAKLNINFTEKNVGFVVMGGVANFAHYAAKATLDFLSKRRVQSHFIVDRDERLDSDIANLKALLGDRATLHVLEKRELENYLLDAGAIASLVRDRKGIEDLDADVIDAEFLKALEVLQSRAIELRVSRTLCAPVYLRSKGNTASSADDLRNRMTAAVEELSARASRIEEEFEAQRRVVESEWGNRKSDIVPGTLILDQVISNYGLRYQKDRDGAALARLIDPAKIPVHMRRILTAIVADDSTPSS
ncbi:AAA family ATPase [Micromonospora echinofusca]|uniref:AAA family ATPase n=1 Tax=Micromonospora echinofusca TaxID=47858 RepID=UPI0033247BA3